MPVMFTSSHNSYGRYSLTREISAGILSRTKPKFSASSVRSSVQFDRLFKEFGFRFCLAIDYFGFLLKRIIMIDTITLTIGSTPRVRRARRWRNEG